MNLTKFDYVPDHINPLIDAGRQADESLSKLCPVMVGRIRAVAKRTSSARLILSVDSGTRLLAIATLIPSQLLPKGTQQEIAETLLFTEIDVSELAERYRNGTLDPFFHAGDETSLEHAKLAVASEKAANADALEETLAAAG